MYNKINEDIKQDYYQNNYSNDGQKFVAWYLRNIHNLEAFEAEDCITDGPDDKQIDAVYIDNNNESVYLIQGKFVSSNTINASAVREIRSAWIQIKDLNKLQQNANSKLKVKISEISKAIDDEYKIIFELVTTARLTRVAKNELETLQSELADDETISADISIVDKDLLKLRYDEALNRNRPNIEHAFNIDLNKCLEMNINGIKTVIVALLLNECVNIPGIVDGSLFKKNVRQSLGNNKVNKEIAFTLRNDSDNFFYYHNGITATCSEICLENNLLKVKDLNVVNGCQSLTTIKNCSEAIKNKKNGHILFRFYQISDKNNIEKISSSTNSQSTVTARDLRSNDKYVLNLKKSYEIKYNDGFFVTKRGEPIPSNKNKLHIVYLTELGKQLMSWHSQRPNMAYSETKIFDKYFEQLFHKDYEPEKIQALNDLTRHVKEKWVNDNPLNLNKSLLAMKAYAPNHMLYAISLFFCEINNQNDLVPNPQIVYEKLVQNDLLDTIVKMAGQCLDMAFKTASNEPLDNDKIFSPQNWIKAKKSLIDLKNAVKIRLDSLAIIPEFNELKNNINKHLKMTSKDFEARWTAD